MKTVRLLINQMVKDDRHYKSTDRRKDDNDERTCTRQQTVVVVIQRSQAFHKCFFQLHSADSSFTIYAYLINTDEGKKGKKAIRTTKKFRNFKN